MVLPPPRKNLSLDTIPNGRAVRLMLENYAAEEFAKRKQEMWAKAYEEALKRLSGFDDLEEIKTAKHLLEGMDAKTRAWAAEKKSLKQKIERRDRKIKKLLEENKNLKNQANKPGK